MSGILVTKPGALSLGDRAILREQGIVAIEAADPTSVKLITPEGQELSGSSLFYAAMRALNTERAYASDARELFAKAVLAEVQAARTPPPPAVIAPQRDSKGRFAKARGEQVSA